MELKQIELTPEERDALYFILQVPGGRFVSEAIQLSLEQKGLVTPVREGGRRWLTVLGDRVRRGRAWLVHRRGLLIFGPRLTKNLVRLYEFHLPTMIFDIIRQQVKILRRPLAAVVLSTVPRRSSPMLLLLHWHGFVPHGRERSPPLPSTARQGREPVPSSALQLNQSWTQLEQLDQQMLDAAWQLGAWSLVREEHRGCNEVGASPHEAMACRQAFGDNPLSPDDETHLVAEAPDRTNLRDSAARLGYVRWLFRPVAGGLWRHAGEDDSLLPDGGRLPPCPVAPKAAVGTHVSRSSYQLGRNSRIVLL